MLQKPHSSLRVGTLGNTRRAAHSQPVTTQRDTGTLAPSYAPGGSLKLEFVALGLAAFSIAVALSAVMLWRRTKRRVLGIERYLGKLRAEVAQLENSSLSHGRIASLERRVDELHNELRERLTAGSEAFEEPSLSVSVTASSAAIQGAQASTSTPITTPTSEAVAQQSPFTAERPSEPARRDSMPVELQGGQVVRSRSLVALASLVSDEGRGEGRLFINEAVEIDHIAFDRWAPFFNFGNGRPYRRFRTVEPALVQWDPASQRGSIIKKGTLEEQP